MDEFRITGGNVQSLETSVREEEKMSFDISDGTASVLCKEGIVRNGNGDEITATVTTLETEKKLASLTVIPPEKTDYIVGESLDLTGMEVQAYYSDGSCRTLAEEDYHVSGFDADSAGEKEITVSFAESGETVTNSFSVLAHSKDEQAASIEADGTANVAVGSAKELNITVTPETFDTESLLITSSDESVAAVNGTYIVGISAGTAEITITDPVGRVSATCKVTVNAAPPGETVYWINTMIGSLGDSITEEDRDLVIAIRTAVDSLDEEMQYNVNYDTLEAAEEALGIDAGQSAGPGGPDDPDDPGEPETPDKPKLNGKFPVVKITKVKPAKKRMTVVWKKLSGKQQKLIASIEVEYSLKRSFPQSKTKAKKVGKKRSSLTVKKLTAKKVYYVRVRTVKYVNGVKNVSKWSKIKKVKIK